MAQDTSKIINLGPCLANIGGVDMGHSKEPVVVEITDEIAEATVNAYGKTPVAAFYVGSTVTAKIVLAQTELDKLGPMFPGATTVTSGANSRLDFGKVAGTKITGLAVILTPLSSTYATTHPVTITNAIVSCKNIASFGPEAIQSYEVTVKGMIDTTQIAGKLVASFGNTSISADTVAPTMTCVPTQGSSGVLVSASAVLTLSKEILPSSVTDATVVIFADVAGTEIACSRTLVNNGASTTITVKPDSNLTAATKYYLVVSGIKSLAGVEALLNRFSFTTA